MAKSGSYYGLRRGSTKSHTYQVQGGKQITKDRVEGGKNPRSLAQMIQRCLVATIGIAYAAFKFICDHSFEEKTEGMESMREFFHKNLVQIRIAQTDDNGFFGFSKYGESGLVAGSYVISEGSLPAALTEADILSVNVAEKQISIDVASGRNNNIGDIAGAMGCKNFNDSCTVVIMYPKADGSYGTGAVRFTYVSGTTVLDSFPVEVVGDIKTATPSYSAGSLTLNVRMTYEIAAGATADNTYMVAIASRYMNGKWYRSKAQFDVQEAKPTFAEAIATYPVGKERFMNGSAVAVTTPATDGGTTGGGTDDGTGTITPGGDTGGDTGGGGDDNGGTGFDEG